VKKVWWVGGALLLLVVVSFVLAIAFAAKNTPGRLELTKHPQQAAVVSPTPAPQALRDACLVPSSSDDRAQQWILQPGSQAGFRAHETFADVHFPNEAVARTDLVAGYLVSNTDRRALRSGCIAVDLRGLRSIDKLPPPLPPASNRDMLFRDIFDLDNFPIAVFKPQAMRLPVSDQGKVVHLTIEGQITIRGTTKTTSAATDCSLDGRILACAGSTVVDAREFRLQVPGADSPIQVDPMITIEFSLIFA
jgi:YceI-like domain